MGKVSKKLAIATMLTSIVGVIFIAGWSGSSPQPVPEPPVVATTIPIAPEEIVLQTPPIQLQPVQPEASRVSVTFSDEARRDYALLKGVPLNEKSTRLPSIDVWYGQYSDLDFRALPASPSEKEPSRLNVKISFDY